MMNTILPQSESTETIGRQIQKHVRRLIASGELASGERLPSTQELAEAWTTHVTTVHRALTPLVRQGLLTRTRRVGTFVRKGVPTLACVGVYYPTDFWLKKTFAFYGSLHTELRKLLQQSRATMTTWVDPRPMAQQHAPLEALVNAAKHREFQALIVPFIHDREHYAWLRKMPVPWSCCWENRVPTAVSSDLLQFADVALECVCAQGGRSVGMIADISWALRTKMSAAILVRFYDHFRARAVALGLTVKPAWMGGPPCELSGEQHAQFGYDQFHVLWGRPDRPDTLITWPDSVAPGVLMAIAKQGVRVPQDLKLVIHKNDKVDLFCPVPASLVITRVEEMAKALLEQVRKQVRGERCRQILVPYHIQLESSPETVAGTGSR